MKKTGTFLFLTLLIITIVGALVLVNKNQDTRKGASFANTKLMLLPNSRIDKAVGEVVPVKIHFLTESGAKVDGVQTELCWGSHLKLDESGIVVNTQNGFDSNPIIVIKDNCVTLVATSKLAADKLKTTGEVFALNFKALSEGEGSITINKESSMVTGDNSASALDKEIAVTAVENTTYKIAGSSSEICETDADCPAGYECYQPPMPTCPPSENCLDVLPFKYCRPISSSQWPVLNYKVQYAFVKSDYSKCFVPSDWPLQVTVLSGGITKIYKDVVPTKISRSGDFVTAEGSLILDGFDKTTNIAVFIKGPKHLQMKYAIDNQKTRYSKAGGELNLTKSIETSPVYDFTAYPILSGDVVGKNSNNPDGVVDGYDWTEVKKWAKVLETVEDGGYIKSDLDGSCQVNSNDLYQLRKTLEEKQGELY